MGWVWVWETEVAEPTVISLLKPDGVCYSVKTITENLVVQVPLNNETNPQSIISCPFSSSFHRRAGQLSYGLLCMDMTML